MYKTGNKKMLNMLILEILQVYSDEQHPLTQQEIIRLLKLNYDMECDRRSVKNNVLYLKELGYDISMDDGYFLSVRQFEDAELRLLIDSVLCSKNMTMKQAKVLIEKLQSCGNKYFKPKVTHVHVYTNLYRKVDKKDRLAAGNTMQQYENAYTQAFVNAIKKINPSWNIGQAIPTGILDEISREDVELKLSGLNGKMINNSVDLKI